MVNDLVCKDNHTERKLEDFLPGKEHGRYFQCAETYEMWSVIVSTLHFVGIFRRNDWSFHPACLWFPAQ